MAVDAFFFISGPWIEHGFVRQHGPAFVGNMQNIPMAFLTLVVFERGVGRVSRLFPVIFVPEEMDKNILDPVSGFGIEEIERAVGGRQMAVHAVGNKPLGVVGVSRCFPRVEGELDFMARRAKPGGRRSNHGVICDGKNRKGDENTDHDQRSAKEKFLGAALHGQISGSVREYEITLRPYTIYQYIEKLT